MKIVINYTTNIEKKFMYNLINLFQDLHNSTESLTSKKEKEKGHLEYIEKLILKKKKQEK